MTSQASSVIDFHNENKQLNIEARMQRIKSLKGVIGVFLISKEGAILKSTADNITTSQFKQIGLEVSVLVQNMIKDINPENEANFVRISSTRHEITVALEKNQILVVAQQCDGVQGDLQSTLTVTK